MLSVKRRLQLRHFQCRFTEHTSHSQWLRSVPESEVDTTVTFAKCGGTREFLSLSPSVIVIVLAFSIVPPRKG